MVFIDKRLQPVYTLLLDCPGKNSIKLSPLPVVDPWVERRKAALCLQVGEGGRDDYEQARMNVVKAFGTNLAFS
ncbi:MAG: hypothetical protein WBF05_16865 [Anaerolineales bacterium]